METFHEVFWWFGITLFTVAAVLFYGLLLYTIYAAITGKDETSK
jgi:hypothetical protein